MARFQYKTMFFRSNSPLSLHFQQNIPIRSWHLYCNLQYVFEQERRGSAVHLSRTDQDQSNSSRSIIENLSNSHQQPHKLSIELPSRWGNSSFLIHNSSFLMQNSSFLIQNSSYLNANRRLSPGGRRCHEIIIFYGRILIFHGGILIFMLKTHFRFENGWQGRPAVRISNAGSCEVYLQSERDLSIAGMYIQSRQHLQRSINRRHVYTAQTAINTRTP